MSVRAGIDPIKEEDLQSQSSRMDEFNHNDARLGDNYSDDDDNVSIDFVQESNVMKLQGSKKLDGSSPSLKQTSRKLSHFSSQFDFDGNDSLDKIESAVRDLYRKSGPGGPSKQDLYELAKDQFTAKREAQMFRKMAAVFAFIGILMVATTFGLVFAAVKFTKDTKVSSDGRLVGTRRKHQHQNQPISTLESGNLAQVYVGDDLIGTDIVVLEHDETPQTYVGTISKQNVEQVWMERQIGVQSILTNVHYDSFNQDDYNWMISGNIDRYHYSDRTVYTNFETSYFPGLVFSVICYKHNSDVCAITQKSKIESRVIANTRRQLLDAEPIDSDERFLSGKQKEVPPGDGRGRRRLKLPDASEDDQEQFWNDHINDDIECWMMNYELSLMVVKGHLVMVATPITAVQNKDHTVGSETTTTTTSSMISTCPAFSVDVDYPRDDNHKATKMVTIVSDEDEEEYEFLDRYVFGKKLVPLIDFSKAVNEARVTQQEESSIPSSYDVFRNNCATLMLDILYDLDMINNNNDDDDGSVLALIDFVTDELLIGDTFLMQVIDEMSNESWMESLSRRLMGDRVLVRTIVKNYIDTHMDQRLLDDSEDLL